MNLEYEIALLRYEQATRDLATYTARCQRELWRALLTLTAGIALLNVVTWVAVAIAL
jgi:hypothetical protein